MIRKISKYKDVTLHALPSLIAISTVEIMNVETYIYGPVSHGASVLILWLTLQTVAGFLFAFLSDRPAARKHILVICQLLGVVGGIILSIFGFEIWVIVIMALLFNPLPVARAAILDIFPQHSQLKLIALTFFAQHLPWVFYSGFALLPYKNVVFVLLGVLTLNTLLTLIFFKNPSVTHKKIKTREIIKSSKNKFALFATLIAFVFAETTFYLLWVYLEYDPQKRVWISITTCGTIIGIAMAMLYNRIPHISIITLAYIIGAATTGVTLAYCLALGSPCSNDFVNTMSHYAIIGGLYLPFVTDAVINLIGAQHKAFGSATIELAGTIAFFFAAILNIVLKHITIDILAIIITLYFIAFLVQRMAEKRLTTVHTASNPSNNTD